MLFLFLTPNLMAQTISGRMSVSGLNTTIKQTTAVDFFKAWRDGKYKVSFNYKANQVNSKGLVLFNMKTTVRYEGKIISQNSRDGWPWLPGDMFVPVEAFDLIPALQKYSMERSDSRAIDSPLPKGKYEVSFEMVPVGISGSKGLSPAQFSFTVR